MYDAKPTPYRDTMFRSQNEAKWAMFMRLTGIEAFYEPEVLEGINSVKYRPDFFLPQYHRYVEVKSSNTQIFDERMAQKLEAVIDFNATPASNGILLLGSFPWDVRSSRICLKTKWLFCHKGVCCADAYIYESPESSYTVNPRCFIRFSNESLDTGEPLPLSTSANIVILPDSNSTGVIHQAISAVNEHFRRR